MTTDRRRSSRRGADNQDTGYALGPVPQYRHDRYRPPTDTRLIVAAARRKSETGLCQVCGGPADSTSGVTCGALSCITAWVFGA